MSSLLNPRVLGPLWGIYEAIASAMGLGLLLVLCVLWLPCALCLFLLPVRWRKRTARWVHSRMFRFYLGFLEVFCACRFDLSALDTLDHDEPLVLVANHPSLLDAVMMIARLPNMVCIMKSTLLNNPLLGVAARVAGYIPNVGPLEMMLHARSALGEGAQLLVFPEGSRTRNFPLDACAAVAAVVAKGAAVPVQTVLIECSSPYLGKDWPLFRPAHLPLHFRVVLGQRLAIPTDIKQFTQAMENYLREELQDRPPTAQGPLSDMTRSA